MSEPKHTKGPWRAIEINWERSLVVDEDAARIALVYIRDEADEETQNKFEAIKNADANLIAAAPDMYEALKEVIKIYSFKEMVRTDKTINSPRDDPDRGKIFFTYNDLSKARNALRKARGEGE